jgi:hypothetical protein
MCPLLVNLLTRPDMASKFTMMLLDIGANLVTPESVGGAVDLLYGAAEQEITYALSEGMFTPWVRRQTMLNSHGVMVDFARGRYDYIVDSLVRHFGYGRQMFNLRISGGEAVIGTLRGTSARYFNHMKIPVTPVIPPGYEFDHWVLHGERVYDKNIIVAAPDAFTRIVDVELVIRPLP